MEEIKNDSKKEKIIGDYLLYQQIYSTIEIGHPKQYLTVNYNFWDAIIKLSDISPSIKEKHSFNLSLSDSKKIINENVKIEGNNYTEINENLYLNNDLKDSSKKQECNINLYYKNNAKESYLQLGLKYPNKESTYDNIIRQLKDNKIIDNYLWFITFKEISDNKFSRLIMGEYPHNIYNLSKDNLKNIYTINLGVNKLEWGLKFSDIYYTHNNNKITLTTESNFIFNYHYNCIIGPMNFQKKIYNNYFKNYIDKKQCQVINIDEIYFGYLCNIKYEEIKKYPSIKFYHKDYDYTFELTYEDLFDKTNNSIEQYIYKIIFLEFSDSINWDIGMPFLKKYQFVFNIDNKMIGFYSNSTSVNPDDKEKEKRNENKDNSKKILKYVGIIGGGIIIVVVIVVIILKCCLLKNGFSFLRKKKLANELNDEFEYNPKESPLNLN